MDRLRVVFANIGSSLRKVGPTERLLIGSFAVILLMGLFLVSQWASSRSMVPLLPGAPASDQERAKSYLAGAGVDHAMRDGAVMVPADRKDRVLAQLTQAKALPRDSAGFFKSLVESQHWSHTRQQNDQLYVAALKSELDRIISEMPGVDSASVMIDVPEPVGLGAQVRRPTASVMVFTSGGGPLEQKTVDAIAYLVGGSKAGLTPERVRVIDPKGQRKATSEHEAVPTTYLEHAARVENDTREKLSDLLGYIPGVVVAVTAQVDVTRVSSKVSRAFNESEGSVSMLKRSQGVSSTQAGGSSGAEPGVRANASVDVNRGGGGRVTTSTSEEKDTEYENQIGMKVDDIVDPRGMPTMIAVSVNVPRGYVAGLVKSGNPEATVGEAEIDEAFEKKVRPAVESSILPHVRTLTQASGGKPPTPAELKQQVSVSLIPVELAAAPPQSNNAGLLGGALGGNLASGLIEKAVLGVLAVASLGMMFMMVRRASKRADLPTAQELVGTPPPLQSKSDLIGEADETEAALAGIEVDEGEMRTAQILEQVSDLVREKPETASTMVKRWITIEH
ncbi:MAG: hypothetical protein HRU70_12660 [Phycisphaeraceae bacterium]|nr:MAG: hypothetical protein HRU70_12660 [Phycisphaeraceae bacterium]